MYKKLFFIYHLHLFSIYLSIFLKKLPKTQITLGLTCIAVLILHVP